ncbi:phosphoglycolate phosphatase [Xaviernesmea oryzae]|uniref:phosphoglycolate phosphatase n=1 Tax=Xaviernesmea oryzae TaxID=464029 RepID=A0A1Q9B0L9_9HYPH|nr:phosphoglycolate phosphatase [Xaviernesmea oryzae]
MIDTAHDLVDSLNHAVTQAGLEPVSYEDLTFLVGSGAKAMIERTFALRERPLSDEDLAWQMAEFVAHYHANMPGASKPYDGLIEALDRLETEGYAFAVCTNKMEKLARTLLSTLKLDHRFKAITGGDTFDVRKPHAEHLLGTIRLAGGDPARAIMVGDSLNDILAARNAKIPVIAVPFGYSDVPIETLKPDVIIKSYDRLTGDMVDGLIGN